MAEISLTQSEADELITCPKVRADAVTYDYPGSGGSISIPLISKDKRETFVLDISRGRIKLQKCTYQNRARQVIVLVRLDLEGSPHMNPDGQFVEGDHIHLYKEGFGDKWAYPVPHAKFTDTSDLWRTMEEFMTFCNIVERPDFRRGLFT